MSSDDEATNDGAQKRQRRVQRACDICRRKKIRCDGIQMEGNRCSNCIAYNYDCTYIEAARKRGPPKAYVEGLENRVEKMERLLRQIMPDDDFRRELGSFSSNHDSWSAPKREVIDPPIPQAREIPSVPADIALDVIRKWDTAPAETKENIEAKHEEDEHLVLSDNVKRLAISPEQSRFFGKSSGIMLIQTAIDLKEEYTKNVLNRPFLPDLRRPEYWKCNLRRPEFWEPASWERTVTHIPRFRYTFPEEDLMSDLVDLYFKNINIFMPLLHRPTFERNIAEKLHLENDMFGAVLLLVCANGSRYSDDPRVLLDGVDNWLSCGWKWFDQVQLVRNSLLSPPTLYDLQFYCLSCQFLQGSSAPHACWTMVGMGIRLAQDIGAHRRQISPITTIEGELMKRAFWALVCMDRVISAGLGRPCAIQDEDFDLDMPAECDDEYWEHPDPEMAFKQPPGRPSYVSAFISYLKLMRLLAIALRTIYCINKSKMVHGFAGPQWEQRIVAELDSALNQWVDSVPEHLRWDPNREDEVFFNQSVVLYTQYYLLQILIHRPFIPSPKRPSPLSFPSLAICTNAARSCCHIVDTQRKRKGFLLPMNQGAVFHAGIVLLLNIWGGKRSGLSTDPNREMADVHKCMQVLQTCEKRWHSCGRLWDILYELASVGELPLPKSREGGQNKRDRDSDSPRSTSGSVCGSSPGLMATEVGERSIAGSKRAMKSSASTASTASPASTSSPSAEPPNQQLFSLPMYSDELGRLPLHGQLHYTSHGSRTAGAMDDATGASGGYWFTSQEPPQISPTNMAATTIGGGSRGMNPPMGTLHDLSLPAGYPAFADAEFFNQLTSMTSMTWPSGRNAMAGGNGSGYMGTDANGAMLLSPYQDTQDLSSSDMNAMWPPASSSYGMNDLGTYLTDIHAMHNTQMPQS